jgi:hypothetical protein
MVAADKRKHFSRGVLISMLAGIVFAPPVGAVIAAVVGAGKELLWDLLLGHGTPEWWDFAATTMGGLAAMWFLMVFW